MLGYSVGMLHCRRKTPPCSPHLHAAATSLHSDGDESHDLRPAGPCMNDAQPMPSAATALFREALHEPNQSTSSARLQSDQTPSARASGSPEPGQTAYRGPRAAYNSPVATPCDDQSVLGRNRGVGEEEWVQGRAQRGRQVSRRGRAGSSMPLHTAAVSTPPLDLEQFGFVRLAASRYLGWFPFICHVMSVLHQHGHCHCYGKCSTEVLVFCPSYCSSYHAAC